MISPYVMDQTGLSRLVGGCEGKKPPHETHERRKGVRRVKISKTMNFYSGKGQPAYLTYIKKCDLLVTCDKEGTSAILKFY